jgi:hypothetical protein
MGLGLISEGFSERGTVLKTEEVGRQQGCFVESYWKWEARWQAGTGEKCGLVESDGQEQTLVFDNGNFKGFQAWVQ